MYLLANPPEITKYGVCDNWTIWDRAQIQKSWENNCSVKLILTSHHRSSQKVAHPSWKLNRSCSYFWFGSRLIACLRSSSENKINERVPKYCCQAGDKCQISLFQLHRPNHNSQIRKMSRILPFSPTCHLAGIVLAWRRVGLLGCSILIETKFLCSCIV